jgi:hypothetical protein
MDIARKRGAMTAVPAAWGNEPAVGTVLALDISVRGIRV